jgi:VanZ family protein
MINQTVVRLLAIAFGLAILILSLLPGGPGGFTFLGIPHFDKVGHFGMYGIWVYLLALSMKKPGDPHPPFLLPVLIGAGAGILLEFGQRWMHQGRSFEYADMIANTLGALIGAWKARWVPAFLCRMRSRIFRK